LLHVRQRYPTMAQGLLHVKETLLQRTGPAAFLAAALLAAPSCSQEGSFENGRVLFGPGVFGAQGDGIAWDGTTSIPRSLLTAVTEAMETGNPDAVQAVYLDNIDALVPPILSGEIGYAKRSYGMERVRLLRGRKSRSPP